MPDEGTRFCKHCGQRLHDGEDAMPEPAAAPVVPPIADGTDGTRAEDFEVSHEPARRSTAAITAVVLLVLVLGAGGVWVALARSAGPGGSDDVVVDLRERPRVAWTFDIDEHLGDLRLSRADLDEVYIHMRVLPFGNEVGIVAAEVDTHLPWSPRLFGVDLRSGELLWTSEVLVVEPDRDAVPYFGCQEAAGIGAFCVTGGAPSPVDERWHDENFEISVGLAVVDGRDGAILWREDLGTLVDDPFVSVVGDDLVTVTMVRPGLLRMARRSLEGGDLVWERELVWPDEYVSASVDDRHIVLSAGDVELVDAASGEPLGLTVRGPGDGSTVRYELWPHGVLRTEHEWSQADGLWQVVAALDDTGAERWSENTPRYFTSSDPEVPFLMVDDTERYLVALDPETGEHLWERPWVEGSRMLVSSPSVAVLADDRDLTALDPATGEERWRQLAPRSSDGGSFYGFDAVLGTEALYFTHDRFLYAFDLEDGTEWWSVSRRIDPSGQAHVRSVGSNLVLVGQHRIAGLQ